MLIIGNGKICCLNVAQSKNLYCVSPNNQSIIPIIIIDYEIKFYLF